MAVKARDTITLTRVNDGQGVDSITTEFYLSTSKTTQTGGSWVTTMPTWESGKYVWTRQKIVYKDPVKIEYTTPECDSSWEAANDVKEDLDAKIVTVTNTVADLQIEHDSVVSTVESLTTTTTELAGDVDNIIIEQTNLNSSLKQTSDAFKAEISEVKTKTDGMQSVVNNVSTYFDFDVNGLMIGKSDSMYKTQITNSAFNILYQSNVVGSFSTEGLQTKSLTLDNGGSMTLPPLKLSSVSDGWIITKV